MRVFVEHIGGWLVAGPILLALVVLGGMSAYTAYKYSKGERI